MKPETLFKALANENRLRILDWLRNPAQHFPPQVDGDLETDGVCAQFLAGKLALSAATLTGHMRILTEAGLVLATRRGKWVFFRRNEAAIAAALARALAEVAGAPG